MSYSTHKLAVRDSFDDEDISDDVEDEVFIRDGRNGFRSDEERGVKRPLMAPKRKSKSGLLHSEPCKKNSWTSFCIPCCYGILALTALLGLIAGAVGLMMWIPLSTDQLVFWRQRAGSTARIPCTGLQARDVWIHSFPKLTVESPLVLSDVNGDRLGDVIVGYGTGLDGEDAPPVSCELYFGRKPPCSGGVMALDGSTGNVVWRHWMEHPVYTVDCGADLTADGVADCLVAGRSGVFHAVNGHDGSSVWEFTGDTKRDKIPEDTYSPHFVRNVDVYSPRFIHDVDGDGILDILAAHTWYQDSEAGALLAGELVLLSGARGTLLWRTRLPGSEEGYHCPHFIIHPDGEEYVVFGTGGQASAGGLYVVPFASLASMKDVKELYKNSYKGVISPPVLVDINRDGTEDIVAVSFDSNVMTFDGLTFHPLWNYSFPQAETLSPPTPGYFNDDDIPDLMVQFNSGPEFPTYFSCQTLVLDGWTGVPLLDTPILHTLSSQAPASSISLAGFGNDFLLYWAADCVGNEGASEPFTFLPGSSVRAQNSADLCWQRFNSTTVSRLYALSQHIGPPGVILYSSDERKSVEYNNTHNASMEVAQFLTSHPELQDTYGPQQAEVPAESTSSFRHKGVESVLVGDVFPQHVRSRQELNKRPGHDEQTEHRMRPDPWQQRQETADYELAYEPVADREYDGRRDKRSRGPMIMSGVPRLTSAGVIVAPLEQATRNSSVDIIFVTSWVPASTDARVLSPAAKKCIEKKQLEATGAYVPLEALQQCAGVRAETSVPGSGLEVQMGQATVYRLHVSCSCLLAGSCVPILPLEQQSWPGYQGRDGRGFFVSRYT